MFNGIIYNIGKIRSIKRNKKSILIGVKTNLKFLRKILEIQYVVMEYVSLYLRFIKDYIIFICLMRQLIAQILRI